MSSSLANGAIFGRYIWLVGCVFLLLSSACTPARQQLSGDIVRRIQFEGNGSSADGQGDYQLRAAVQQKRSSPFTFIFPFNFFTQPVPLRRGSLEMEGLRLEAWYARHGYFDAKFLGWEIRRARAASDRAAGVVDLIGHVSPGARSFYGQVDWLGLENNRGAQLIQRRVARTAELDSDVRFDLDSLREIQGELQRRLQNNAFAYAQVKLKMQAYPDDHKVDVQFTTTPGPLSRFGETELVGEATDDERLVSVAEDALSFEEGEPFTLKELEETREAIFETQLFSMVNVAPDLSDPTKDMVPMSVELRRAKARRFRVGGGADFDGFKVVPRVRVEYRDLRLFNSLVRLEAKASVGAIVGVVADATSGGQQVVPMGSGSLRLNYPFLLKSKLSLGGGAGFIQDVQYGNIPFRKLTADIGLRYKVNNSLSFATGPKFTFSEFLEESAKTLALAKAQFGGDFSSTRYQLLTWNASLIWDLRDDILAPRKGLYLGGEVSQSIPIPAFSLDGQVDRDQERFLYTRLTGDLRGWLPLRLIKGQQRRALVLSGLLRTTLMVPWKRDASLPYPELSFLGGANSLRGYRANQVGSYDCVCFYPDGRPDPQSNNGEGYDVSRTYLPNGGAFSWEAIFEPRYNITKELSVALFGEVGMLSPRITQISADDLRYGGGLGIRYNTLVGPIRVDLGFRPLFPEDSAAGSYIGCNDIDAVARGYDLFSGSLKRRLNFENRRNPVVINLFFAIGEAF